MKTYNVKLNIEDLEQKQNLLSSLKMEQRAWNIVSEVRFSMKGGRLKILHDNCYRKVKKQVNGIPSQFIIKAEQSVIAAYKTIKENQHKLESPAKKKNLSIRLDKRIYRWINDDNKNLIKITTCKKQAICKFKTYPKLQEFFDNDKFELKDPLLFYRDGDFYLALTFDDDKNGQKTRDNKRVIGIDLGIKRLIATSEGMIIKGNEFNGHKRRIRYNKRQLQSKSRNSHSTRTKLNKLRRKERNFSKNYTHHVVNKVLRNTEASTIVLEDLSKIKRKNRGRKFNNRLSQVPFYMFKEILIYKAQLFGKKRVVTVNPYYTSQLDHRGLIGGKRRGCRYYGVDGKVLDSDLNAAINIAQKWIKENRYAKPSSRKHFVSCCCAALDGQANVNWPIVGFLRQAPSELGRGG